MKGLIYIATNLYNGRSYVGQTRNTLKHRMNQHYQDAKKSDSVNSFHYALAQYGKSAFEWRILDEFSGSKEEVIHALNVAEEYHILKHRTMLEEHGYNATRGGYSSDKFSEVIKRRAKSGSKYKPVLQYDLDGNFIKEYESLSCACYELAGRPTGITLGKVWHGFQWVEKISPSFPKRIDPYKPEKLSNAVVVYTKNGEFYKEYETASKCFKELGKQYRIRESFSDTTLHKRGENTMLVFRKGKHRIPPRIEVEIPSSTPKEASQVNTPVLQYTKKGAFIREYPSIAAAKRKTGVSEACIRTWCNKKPPFSAHHSRSRWIWQYKNGEILENIDIKGIRRVNYAPNPDRMIIQYSRDGSFIKIWKNMCQASLQTEESYNLIRKQCMGIPTRKQTKFIWKFYSPNYPQKIASA